MQSNRKLSNLKAMGIEVWQDRHKAAEMSLSLHCISLQGLSKPTMIIADYDSSKAEVEQQLLCAIAKALGTNTESQVELWHNLKHELSDEAIIIAMGENIAKRLALEESKQTIKTPALEQLLSQPGRKADVWQAIKDAELDGDLR